MRLKSGVRIRGIRPELAVALEIAESVYRHESAELVVTSVTDSEHKRGSLHYAGQAADLRTRGLIDVIQTANGLRDRLGDDFDVVVESDHIHVEYQPKEAMG